jgi:hypothetical protein
VLGVLYRNAVDGDWRGLLIGYLEKFYLPGV